MKQLLFSLWRFLQTDRMDRFIRTVAIGSFLIPVTGPLILLSCFVVYGCGGPVISPPDLSEQFARMYGLPVSTAEKVIRTRGCDFSEEELSFIFRVSPQCMDGWLSTPPLWVGKEWKSGPIPQTVFAENKFGVRSPKAAGAYEVEELQECESAFYAFEQLSIGSHNTTGRALILIPSVNEVWFSAWDCREGF